MRFINTPNLPELDVALSAMSGTYPTITDALRARKIEIINVMPCKALSEPVFDHADMLLHHLGENRIIVAKGEEDLKRKLEQLGFQVIYSNICISKLYPQDVKLNCARIGSRQMIGNRKTMDAAIQEFCACNQIEMINVKQGYAKCSTVVVDNNSIITADPSIAEAATNAGIDVLKITPGYVKLEGYKYGFLGGTCGMIAKGKLAFTGSIQSHPNYDEIKKFCDQKNVELVSLVEGPLLDIGGILPLKTV
ncbi:YvcK family protein [Caproiciproducens faecalis]|uniref:DUF6873 domain-containing protein n=1 Tax=Caproiciproducens faecalis TaxID=2820301 RepID=A0ABS7DR40_9FIRM|nr:YvcK family protein [Caproiciproducens faecalis]MBW7573769.1 hypothetical protein [Caproiciproducens faecalis]